MSGIYIPGVEMPTECSGCPFEMYYLNCGITKCRATNTTLSEDYRVIRFDGRADDCPLIPVPEHGRLMDIDAPYELRVKLHGNKNSIDLYGSIVIPADKGDGE